MRKASKKKEIINFLTQRRSARMHLSQVQKDEREILHVA